MTIRYIRQGLKVVRVVDATEPLLGTPEAASRAVALVEASALIRAAAAGLRADRRRKREWGFGSHPAPGTRGPGRDVPGADLLRARELAGLSQRQLAADRGYSRGLVAECEAGRRSVPADLGEWTRSTLAIYGTPPEGEAQA